MSTAEASIQGIPPIEEVLRPGNEVIIKTDDERTIRLDVLGVVGMTVNPDWKDAYVLAHLADGREIEYDVPLTGPGSDSSKIEVGQPLSLVPANHTGGRFRLHKLGTVASVSIRALKNS